MEKIKSTTEIIFENKEMKKEIIKLKNNRSQRELDYENLQSQNKALEEEKKLLRERCFVCGDDIINAKSDVLTKACKQEQEISRLRGLLEEIYRSVDNIDMVFDANFGITDKGYKSVNDQIEIAINLIHRIIEALEGGKGE